MQSIKSSETKPIRIVTQENYHIRGDVTFLTKRSKSKLKKVLKHKKVRPWRKRKYAYFLWTYKYIRWWAKGNYYSSTLKRTELYYFLVMKPTLKNIFFNVVNIFGQNLAIFSVGSLGNKKYQASIEKTIVKVLRYLKSLGQEINLIIKVKGNALDGRLKRIIKTFFDQKFIRVLTIIDNRPYSHNGLRKKKKKRL